MKVAITSSGNNLDALLDRRFGRCLFFVIYDTSTDGYEIMPNPNANLMEGAGPASVQMVAGKGVEKVVSGDFGLKVKSLFDQVQIQLISVSDETKTVQEIIDLLKRKQAE
jgi:predicted Fe-Mo cluster-binding NifX family protein